MVITRKEVDWLIDSIPGSRTRTESLKGSLL
jgi:hypothetical protein